MVRMLCQTINCMLLSEDQEDNLCTHVTTGTPLERIEMKDNEVYALNHLQEGTVSGEEPLAACNNVSSTTIHGSHGPERIVWQENEVCGLSHEGE